MEVAFGHPSLLMQFRTKVVEVIGFTKSNEDITERQEGSR